MPKRDERNTDSDGYRYTELVAPVFAGFSLPAIITFASDKYPGPPWHNIILSLLVIATSLFIASTGLMTTPITEKWREGAGAWRGLLSGIGICVVASALFILGLPSINQWWAPLVLSPLLIGSIVPALISLVLILRQDSRPGRPAGRSGRDLRGDVGRRARRPARPVHRAAVPPRRRYRPGSKPTAGVRRTFGAHPSPSSLRPGR